MRERRSVDSGQRDGSLRQRTVGGILWVAFQSLASRGILIIQQLVLAWLLAKSDFGLIGLAYTVTSFVTVLSNPGIDAVLVQRQRRFDLWATPAFWMGMSAGLIGMVVMILAAPVAAAVYGKPSLTGLLLVLAIAAPLQTIQIVPRARLQLQLRFRALVLLGLVGNVLTAVLSIVLATTGWGPYSFAIPVPVSAAVVALCTWLIARPHVSLNPRLSRWRFLFGDSIRLGITNILATAVGQGDYLMLGLARVPDSAIGTYVFAFNLSIQAARLISGSVTTVFFPSLSQVSLDPALQTRTSKRGTRLLALIIAPCCILQVLTAAPLFRIALPERWQDAIMPLQILTLGVMFNAPAWPAISLMMAQRRFHALFKAAIWYTVVFFVLVGGSLLISRTIIAVSIAVFLWNLWCSPYVYWTGMRPQCTFFSLFSEIRQSFLAAFIAAIPCLIIQGFMPIGRVADLIQLVVIGTTFSIGYLVVVRKLATNDLQDFFELVTPVLRQMVQRKGSSSQSAATPGQLH